MKKKDEEIKGRRFGMEFSLDDIFSFPAEFANSFYIVKTNNPLKVYLRSPVLYYGEFVETSVNVTVLFKAFNKVFYMSRELRGFNDDNSDLFLFGSKMLEQMKIKYPERYRILDEPVQDYEPLCETLMQISKMGFTDNRYGAPDGKEVEHRFYAAKQSVPVEVFEEIQEAKGNSPLISLQGHIQKLSFSEPQFEGHIGSEPRTVNGKDYVFYTRYKYHWEDYKESTEMNDFDFRFSNDSALRAAKEIANYDSSRERDAFDDGVIVINDEYDETD